MDGTLITNPENEAVTLSKSRHAVCMEATWEIDALCRALPGLVQSADDHEIHLVARGIAGRILRLANALGAALFDEVVTTGDLQRRVMLDGGGG
jgi:hypothetical protein